MDGFTESELRLRELYAARRWPEVEALADHILRVEAPGSPAAWIGLAYATWYLTGSAAAGQLVTRQAERRLPDNPCIAYSVAWFAVHTQEWSVAVNSLRRAIAGSDLIAATWRQEIHLFPLQALMDASALDPARN